MGNDVLSNKIAALKPKVDRLRKALDDMERTLRNGEEKRYVELSLDAVTRSERLAVGLRETVQIDSINREKELFSTCVEAQGIQVEYDGVVFRAILPGQLPRRRWKNSSFLVQPLLAAMMELAQEKNLPTLKEAAVCFVHVYPFDTPSRQMRDYDNIESKQVLDVLSSFLMVDDNPLFCDLHHRFEWGPKRRTEVFIMDRDSFSSWLFSRELGEK